MTRRAIAAVALASALALAACGQASPPIGQSPPPGQEYEVTALVLERAPHGPKLCLGAIAASLPPQCGDVPLRHFDWGMVAGEQSRSGTTWGDATLRGTYDGTAFTVVRVLDTPTVASPGGDRHDPPQPLCATPESTDPKATALDWEATPGLEGPEVAAVWITYGPDTMNVVARPGTADDVKRTIRQAYGGPLCLVERDQRSRSELHSIQSRLTERLRGRLLVAATDEVRGVVTAQVILLTPEMRADVDREFGAGVVELTGRLTPV